ncbi:MAG: RagB/SusD family nutrient uptake outer membrane protein [Saprospiraceae bacterium]|nr:RagB/SusD family nutrient uptake outer membrane protein [Saprospiraceae bacterium]
MRHIKKIFAIGVTASLLLTSACTDLVNEERDSIVLPVTTDGFAKVNVPSFLEAAYKDLSAYTDQNNIYALGQHTSAEMIPPTRGVDWGDNGVWRTLDAHTWDATHSAVLNAWNQLNQRAYRCNEILASDANPQQAAEAKFLRALNMHLVMDYFGQVPFREVTQGVDDLPNILSRSEAFDFIVKDLTEAIPQLPSKGPSTSNTVATKAAANFLLAKLFLNSAVYKSANPAGPYTFANADLDKVITYVNAIEAEGYKLEDNYFDNFKASAKREIIFSAIEGSPQNRWFMTLHYGQNPSGWNGFTTLADFYDTFDPKDSRFGVPAAKNGTTYSGIGYGFLFGQQFDDNGKQIIDSRTQKPLSFTKDVPLAGAATDKGIRVIKYHPATADKYILMRFGEAVLMKAEAQLRSGKAADALATINSLRAKRGVAALGALDAEAMFKEIGFEKYWEGDKRTVEVRFGKFVNGTGSTIDDEHTVLFPIPAQALVSNPNLQQNTGY